MTEPNFAYSAQKNDELYLFPYWMNSKYVYFQKNIGNIFL